MGKGQKATSFQHLISLIQAAEPSFNTMNASNMSIAMNMNGQQMNVSASLKIYTDSVMTLSIYPFMGIELYSIELYPNRWILYDKLNKNYYTDSYDYLFYRFGVSVDYNTFQSLFSARLFTIGSKEIDTQKCGLIPLEDGRNQIECSSKKLIQTVEVANSHTLDKVRVTDESGNFQITTSYNDYMQTRDINYPRNIVLEASDKSGDLNIQMNMKIQKIVFNNELKMSLSNPDRYTRKTLDQLLN